MNSIINQIQQNKNYYGYVATACTVRKFWSAFYTSLPLHRASECPLCVLQILHFCAFLINPHFNLEPDYIVRKPIKRGFQQ